jgi:dipeptidyl aminopeptidase/acylaminoacyl peptidase
MVGAAGAGAGTAPDAPYVSEDVTVRTTGGHTLAGTLTRPRGVARAPAVVLVSGSGPQDRDGAMPLIPGYRPFRQIADTLGRRGIAVLRLDDRGVGGSGGASASVTSADFADDARAALAYLRARPDIDPARLALAGHSEGGMVAPMVAVTDPALRALVLLAGPGRTGREISIMQQRQAFERYMPDSTPQAREAAFTRNLAVADSMAERVPWLRFWFTHDPIATARRVRQPVLVLQGETDTQVPPEHATLLADAIRAGGNTRVTVRLFPALNHLFLPDTDGDAGVQGSRYATLPIKELPPAVLGALADWLVVQLR